MVTEVISLERGQRAGGIEQPRSQPSWEERRQPTEASSIAVLGQRFYLEKGISSDFKSHCTCQETFPSRVPLSHQRMLPSN